MGNISDGPPQPPTHPWRLNPAIAPDVAQPGTASTPEDAEEGAPHGHAHAEARLHKLPWQMSVFFAQTCWFGLVVWSWKSNVSTWLCIYHIISQVLMG